VNSRPRREGRLTSRQCNIWRLNSYAINSVNRTWIRSGRHFSLGSCRKLYASIRRTVNIGCEVLEPHILRFNDPTSCSFENSVSKIVLSGP
jgi:hypothetical protein